MSKVLTASAGVLGALLATPAPADWDIFLDLSRAVPSFQVEEYQPDIKWSGRINTIAVHPTDPRQLTVASESGGLFQSQDGGETWRHLDGMPAWRTVSVAYYGADPQILIATAREDFKTTRGSGIWRSTDGGETWTKAFISSDGGTCPQDAPAWEVTISLSGTIVLVATDCGIAVADGSWNWRRASRGDAGRPFRTVKDIGSRDLVAAGPEGVFYSADFGTTWTRAAGDMRPVNSYHALAVSPRDFSHLYLIEDRHSVDDRTSVNDVYASLDRGRSWTLLTSPPRGNNGCGGVPFIRAAAVGSRTHLYAGNRCEVYRREVSDWTEMESDHSDARDLVLMGDEPTFLASDGGFHMWDAAGLAFVSKGGNGRGLSALQVYEVTGQQIEGGSLLGWPPRPERRRYDLYIGTQDNDIWSSANSGRTWPFSRFFEGFRIDLPRSVRSESQSRVVFTACGACGTGLSRPHFRGEVDFPDATRAPDKPYSMLREGTFTQYGRLGARGERGVWGLHFTEDYGDRWRVVDIIPEDPASLAQYSGTPALAYFAVRTGTDAQGRALDKLVRVSNLLGGGPPPECDDDGFTSVFRRCYPDMTGHGGLGRRSHGFVGESVFAVDPSDPMHLIAPDPRDGQVKDSWDGGKSWQPIPGSRELVTRGGTLQNVADPSTWASLVSVVSFHPEHATLVLMGTREGGLYFSNDRGRHWRAVPGSEQIVNVTSFHWKSHNEVFVSSYGRGLWRLRIAYAAPVIEFGVACGERCFLADLGSPVPVPFDGKVSFDGAIVTYGGGVMDAQADSGLLKSIAVTPGTTWLLSTPDGKHPTSVAQLAASGEGKTSPSEPITESSDPGDFKGLESALALMKQGWLIRGFTLADGKVKHVVVADDEPKVKGPGSEVPFKNTGKTASGALERAYVSVEYRASRGRLIVVGERFRPGHTVTLLLDGQSVGNVKPGMKGRFTAKLRPGLAQGQHSFGAVQKVGKLVVSDTTEFLVPSADGVTAKGKEDDGQDEDEDGEEDEDDGEKEKEQ